jgi:hypothetical protein
VDGKRPFSGRKDNQQAETQKILRKKSKGTMNETKNMAKEGSATTRAGLGAPEGKKTIASND